MPVREGLAYRDTGYGMRFQKVDDLVPVVFAYMAGGFQKPEPRLRQGSRTEARRGFRRLKGLRPVVAYVDLERECAREHTFREPAVAGGALVVQVVLYHGDHPFLETFSSRIEPGFHGVRRDAEERGDLTLGVVGDIVEHHDRALGVGKGLNDRLDSDARMSAFDLGVWGRCRCYIGRRFQRDRENSYAPRHAIAVLEQDLAQPCREFVRFLKFRQVPVDLQKCLLCGVFGEIEAAQERAGIPDRHILIAAYDPIEGRPIAGLRTSNKADGLGMWIRSGHHLHHISIDPVRPPKVWRVDSAVGY